MHRRAGVLLLFAALSSTGCYAVARLPTAQLQQLDGYGEGPATTPAAATPSVGTIAAPGGKPQPTHTLATDEGEAWTFEPGDELYLHVPALEPPAGVDPGAVDNPYRDAEIRGRFSVIHVEDDHLRGTLEGGRAVEVHLDAVDHAEVSRFDGGQTALLVGGIVVGYSALLALIIATQGVDLGSDMDIDMGPSL